MLGVVCLRRTAVPNQTALGHSWKLRGRPTILPASERVAGHREQTLDHARPIRRPQEYEHGSYDGPGTAHSCQDLPRVQGLFNKCKSQSYRSRLRPTPGQSRRDCLAAAFDLQVCSGEGNRCRFEAFFRSQTGLPSPNGKSRSQGMPGGAPGTLQREPFGPSPSSGRSTGSRPGGAPGRTVRAPDPSGASGGARRKSWG